MSTFSDASLVLVPSGIKNQKVYSIKPTDGSGDLTFSRASNATRVNSSGLVEKVRTNVVLYSQDQTNGVYSANASIASVTAVSNPLTGQNDAFKITSNASDDPYFLQNVSGLSNGENTFSCWLWTDSGQSTEATLFFYNQTASEVYTKSITLTTTPTRYDHTVNFSNIGSSAVVRIDLRQVGPSIQYVYTYGWQAESGVMTDYIATTTTSVSVGPVSGLPRLDYSGGASCPALKLEPQRSNLLTFSEQMDNVAWAKTETSVTANNGTSPDGYTNADKLIPSATNTYHETKQAFSGLSGSYTVSAFFKASGYNYAFVRSQVNTGSDRYAVIVDLTNGTAYTNSTGSPTGTSYKVDNYGSGWYRLSVTATTNDYLGVTIGPANGSTFGSFSLPATFSGNGTDGILAWGGMAEAGAYATSYIPTLSSAVTRVADAASKTGISSLIGQTEGVVFLEVGDVKNNAVTGAEVWYLEIRKDQDNSFGLASAGGTPQPLRFVTKIAGTAVTEFEPTPFANSKIAIKYTSTQFKLFLNGALATTVNKSIGNYADIEFMEGAGVNLLMVLNQFLVFPTALSDADCITLTA